jgi:hypothetical protein
MELAVLEEEGCAVLFEGEETEALAVAGCLGGLAVAEHAAGLACGG